MSPEPLVEPSDESAESNGQPAEPFSGDPPTPYLLTDDGLYALADPHQPGGQRWRVSGAIRVLAYARASDSAQWGKLLAWTDPDGKPHEHVMPLSALQGDGLEICRVLADGGLTITPGLDARKALIDYLSSADPDPRISLVNNTGWHEVQGSDVYVLPQQTLGQAAGREEVRLSVPLTTNLYATSGTFEEWRDRIGLLCRGNSRLQLAVSAAFAGVLMHFSEVEGGGDHLRGPSSTGKTTAALVAVSVFGGHQQMQRWRATSNGLEAIAALHNNALLVLDELGQVDPREAGEIAYALANGTGKQRMTRTATAARRYVWRLQFFSTGEIGLSQHMASVGRQTRAGQEVRLAELEADAGKGHGLFDQLHGHADGASLSEALRAATRSFHGAVGVEFIRRAVEGAELLKLVVGERIRDFVTKCRTEFAQAGEFGGQAHRVCERYGLKAVAGELATEWGLTGWDKGEAHAAMKRCFGEWLAARGTAGNAEPAAIVDVLRAFLNRNEEARFTDVDMRSVASIHPSSRKTVYSRAGWRKVFDGDEREYLIDVTVFQKEIFAGHDIGLVCRVLSEALHLQSGIEGGQVRYTLQRQLGPDGRRRVYVINNSIWDEPEPPAADSDKGAGDALGDEVKR